MKCLPNVIVVVLLNLFLISISSAEIHSWEDKNGIRHSTDDGPVNTDPSAKARLLGSAVSSQSYKSLESLHYDGSPASLRRIQAAAMNAARSGHLIAIHICRQTMYGLNDHPSLEKLLLSQAKQTDEENIRRWVEVIEKKAQGGDLFFKTVLGILYYNGHGVSKSNERVLELWKSAADGGYHDAWCKLGNLFNTGEIVGKNIDSAISCYTKAGDGGSGFAWYNIGAIYFQWNGFHGIGRAEDRARAVSYYEKAAALQFAPGQYYLGLCYDKGYGVARDHAQALKWLNIAAGNGSFDARQYLLKIGAPVPTGSSSQDSETAQSNPSSHKAFLTEKPAYFKQVEICRSCLTGIFQNIRLCETAQLDAALKNDPELLHTVSEDGWTPLTMAIASGCKAMTTYLVEKGADINERHHELNFTPLHIAILTGQKRIVTFLIEKGADINAVANDVAIPLNRGCWYSRMKGTPLHNALYNSKFHLVELLLASGANPNIRDQEGNTFFEFAVNLNHREEVAQIYNGVGLPVPEVPASVEELISAISDCKIVSTEKRGRIQVQDLLKADPGLARQKDNDGDTPLHLATFYELEDLVKQLVNLGADVNAVDDNGTTPLHNVVASISLARFLVDHGAIVNAQDQSGRTPLHRIAGFSDSEKPWEVARFLLAHGADKSIRDNYGRTPHEVAVSKNHSELAQILE